MKFEAVENGMGCCVICRGPIFGKAIVAGGFDFICQSCVTAIVEHAAFLTDSGKPDVKTFVCPNCGQEFDNKGSLLAHRKKCKKMDGE